MVRGYYTTASGAITQQRVINTISNNIANAKTPGYKKDFLGTNTFDDFLISKYESYAGRDQSKKLQPLANDGIVRYAHRLYTDFTPGSVDHTSRALDLALMDDGKGFFMIEGDNAALDEASLKNGTAFSGGAEEHNQILLTRNGSFAINQDGYLVTADGRKVLGQNDETGILVATDDFEVDENGNVLDASGKLIDTLAIAYPPDLDKLVKYDKGYFVDTNPLNESETTEEEPKTTAVLSALGNLKQGYIERSNLQVTREMTNLVASQRAFQTCGQIIKLFDKMTDKSINDVGRMR